MIMITRGAEACCVQQIQEEGPLVVLLDPHHLLGDVLGGGADAADGQEDVVVKEVTSEHLKSKFK